MGRRHGMSHSAVLRSELGEGMGHLWHAAGHAPGAMMDTAGPAWRMARGRMRPGMRGMRRTGMRGMRQMGMGGWAMSPSLGVARRFGTRVAAMAPLAAMAPTGGALSNRRANRAMTKVIMKKESKSGRRRLGMLVGLLAAGATAGAAAAMAARRRNRLAWEEYETHGHGYQADRSMPVVEPMDTAGRTTMG